MAAAALIPLMTAGVSMLGCERVLRWAAGCELEGSDTPVSAPPVSDTVRVVRAVRRAAFRSPYHGNCLSRSLALVWLLRRRGVDAQLRLGARVADGRLEGHAWVERDGVVLNDQPEIARGYPPLGPRPWQAPARKAGAGA